MPKTARRVKMRFVADHPQCAPLIAEADGAVVGTGVATFNGPVAWIGTIWVDPAWRRRGLGRALTVATMEAAEAAGCRTFVLVATRVGQPLYEGLGFEVQTWYTIKEAPGLAPGQAISRARPYRPSDLAAMADLDAAATGEDRRHLLAAFASPGTTLCVERPDGGLGGFAVRAPVTTKAINRLSTSIVLCAPSTKNSALDRGPFLPPTAGKMSARPR